MAADGFRVRLEGGAEVLEAAAVRLRALNGILDSLNWRERLAGNDELVEAIRKDDAQVRAVLQRAERLQEVEPSRELAKLIKRVREELTRAEALTSKRSPAQQPAELSGALALLRADALPTPTGEAKRWRLARASLRSEPRALSRVRELLPRLRELSSRPKPARAVLPWEKDELSWLLPALAEVDGLCAALWKRLAPDVERAVLSHDHLLDSLPDDAPSLLLRAESVRRLLHSRMEEALKLLFAPLVPSPHEAQELLGWVVSRRDLPKLKPPARAHLFALAARLAEGPPKDAERWEELLSLAKGAGDEGPDAAALLDNLKLFLRIKQQKHGAPKRSPATLFESLLLLRALSS